jgi:hypothetical protein
LTTMPGPRLLSAALVAALGFATLTGCGDDGGQKQDRPSKAALACRAKWHQLGEDIAPQVKLTQPSALPQRWNTVAATVDYYRTTATKSDCGDRLDQQEKAISTLKAFSSRLTVFDMEAQLALVKDDAQAYAAGPWPPAPTPTPGPTTKKKQKHKKQPKPVRPPQPALVGKALTTLAAQAPIATQQQGPGWEQASVIDLGDTAATAKAVKDLQFLSTQSSGWQVSQAELLLIRKALAANPG